jgi:hypothetical protein
MGKETGEGRDREKSVTVEGPDRLNCTVLYSTVLHHTEPYVKSQRSYN